MVTEIEIAGPGAGSGVCGRPGQRGRVVREHRPVEWRSSPPAEIGSDIAFTARFLGRSLTYTYRIIELVAGERLVMSAAEGPFPMETTYTWRDTPGGGTRMTLRNRGRPRGFVGVASPLMARSMRRANIKDLRQLKAILGGRTALTPEQGRQPLGHRLVRAATTCARVDRSSGIAAGPRVSKWAPASRTISAAAAMSTDRDGFSEATPSSGHRPAGRAPAPAPPARGCGRRGRRAGRRRPRSGRRWWPRSRRCRAVLGPHAAQRPAVDGGALAAAATHSSPLPRSST